MPANDFTIRTATSGDADAIGRVCRASFAPEGEGEADRIARFMDALLHTEARPRMLALLAEETDRVVGCAAFSPARIIDAADWQGYILAPLAVAPTMQKRGIGGALIRHGLEQLTREGVDRVFVYGDPAYYGRFGFNAQAAEGFSPPHPLEYPFGWQALALKPDANAPLGGTLSCVPPLDDASLW